MSYVVRVFCRSRQRVALGEVARFVREGVFFDPGPTFDPPDAPERMGEEEWASLEIRYDPALRPVVLGRTPEGGEAAEATETLPGGPKAAAVRAHLAVSTTVYAIEVDAGSLSDDAWAMVDALGAYLARRGDGIVYAPGDGFFDADLQLLVRCR